jgi:SAM-dependent methyltransferase
VKELPSHANARAHALAERSFWDDRHDRFGPRDRARRFFAHEILAGLLPHGSIDFLEIGCAPGRFMAYFAETFAYRVTGLDYSGAIHRVPRLLIDAKVSDFRLIRADFFGFYCSGRFDVVFSAGFVEHFENPIPVFDRHYDLLRPGGLLVVSMPNLRYGQKVLRLLLGQADTLDYHNLRVMDPEVWIQLARTKGMRILSAGYVETFDFWLPTRANSILRTVVRIAVYAVKKLLLFLHLDQIPNRFFSPHILLVAKKSSSPTHSSHG